MLTFLSILNAIPTSALYFSDNTKDKSYYYDINYSATRGWISGFTDGTYRPNDTLSWSQAITILSRVSDGTLDMDDFFLDFLEFVDTNELNCTVENLNDPINRYDLGCLLVFYLNLDIEDTENIFSDLNDEITTTLYKNCIISGKENQGLLFFDGSGFVTRAQIAIILNNLEKSQNTNLFDKNKNIYLKNLDFIISNMDSRTFQTVEEATTYAFLYLALTNEKQIKVECIHNGKTNEEYMKDINYSTNLVFASFPELLGVYDRRQVALYQDDEKLSLTFKMQSKFTDDFTGANDIRNQSMMEAISLLNEIKNKNKNFDNLSNTDKAKILFEAVANNFEYDYNSTKDSNYILKGFTNGVFVCEGYATIYSLLLKLVNIESYVIRGYTVDGYHAWVLANIDGSFKMTDPTWADRHKITKNSKVPFIDYNYFNRTWEELKSLGRYESYTSPDIDLYRTFY